MKIIHTPYPKIINDSFTDRIFKHFDVLLRKVKEDKFVLAVGRLTYQKGFDRLISIFSKLKHKDLSLVILGEGELRNNLSIPHIFLLPLKMLLCLCIQILVLLIQASALDSTLFYETRPLFFLLSNY